VRFHKRAGCPGGAGPDTMRAKPERLKITSIPVRPELSRGLQGPGALRLKLGWYPNLFTVLAIGRRRVEGLYDSLRALNHAGLPLHRRSMNNTLVAVFDAEPAALEGLRALQELRQEAHVALQASAAMVQAPAGGSRAGETHRAGLTGEAFARLAERLRRLVPARPGAPATLSAKTLADVVLALASADVGVDLLSDVIEALAPGKAVLVVEVDEAQAAPVEGKLGRLGGQVFRRHSGRIVEDVLIHEAEACATELRQLKAELAQANPGDCPALRQEIDAVGQQLKETQAQLNARQTQGQGGTAAKIDALRQPVRRAGGQRRARMETYLAEASALQAARRTKLAGAQRLIQQALSA